MNVPKLRFKEFNNDWKDTSLGEITTFKQGIQVDVEKQMMSPNDNSVRFIRIVDYTQNTKDVRYIKLPNNANFVDEKDVVLVRYGATAGFVGHGIKGVIANNMFTVRPNNESELNKDFLYTILKQDKTYNILNNSNGSSAMPALNFSSVSRLKFKYPDLAEQKKLVNIINLLDKKIELQSKKIEDLKLFKKGLLINEFADKICNTNIKDILKVGKAGGTPKSTIQEYYNGEIPFLSISDISSQSKYIEKTEKSITQRGIENSTAWIVPKNSVILSMYASYGLPCINKIELSTSQAMYSMMFNNNIDSEYIYYYLEYLKLINFYDSLVSTGTQPNLNADKINKIKIYVPDFKKQNEISLKYNKVDNKICLENNKLSKLQELKKGLMQSMFV